jgi:hypothetical protein
MLIIYKNHYNYVLNFYLETHTNEVFSDITIMLTTANDYTGTLP